MNGTYIYINKPNSLQTTYIDLKIINLDLPARKCQFYSVVGEFLTEFDISSIEKDRIVISDARLELHREEDSVFILKFMDDPNHRAVFYLKLEPPEREVESKECKYREEIKEVGGYPFYYFRGKRHNEPHLYPITTIKEEDIEYINLVNFEKEWRSTKG